MKLKLYSAKEISTSRPKATVHKSGKLGYNRDAIKDLQLKQGMGILLFGDEEHPSPLCLFMKIVTDTNPDSFKLVKGGQYYYASTKAFMDKLEIDYQSKSIIYDLSKVDIEGETYYKMTGREMKGRGRDFGEEEGFSEYAEIEDGILEEKEQEINV